MKDAIGPRAVTEINKKVMHVNYDEDGVESVILEDGTIIQADVYFDCTGFKKLLIGELTEWISYKDKIPNDRAIGGTAHIDEPRLPTQALSLIVVGYGKNTDRTGSGIVYSLDYTSDDEAEGNVSFLLLHFVNFYKERGVEYTLVCILNLMQVDVVV